MNKKFIIVEDKMQHGYRYELCQPIGMNFDVAFKPELSPKQMLELVVFGGKYMTDCQNEFPPDWFENAQLCSVRHDKNLNFFGVNASQTLQEWQRKGWIHPDDHEVGFNGTAVTTWEDVTKMMFVKLEGGKRSSGIIWQLKIIVFNSTFLVVDVKGKPCFIGHMIVEKYKSGHVVRLLKCICIHFNLFSFCSFHFS